MPQLPGSDVGGDREILMRLQGIERRLTEIARRLQTLESRTDPTAGPITRYALTMVGQALRKEIPESEIRSALEADAHTLDAAFLACWAFYRQITHPRGD